MYYFWNKIYRYHLSALKGTVFQTPLMECSLGYPTPCVIKHGGWAQGKVHTACELPAACWHLQVWGQEVLWGQPCLASLPAQGPCSLCHRPGLPLTEWWVARGLAGADISMTPGRILFFRISTLHTRQCHTVSPRAKCFPSDDRFIAFEGKSSINFN